jgi:hypothetical protein
MKYDQIAKIISTVGFPTVACGALFWLVVDVLQKNTEAISTLTQAITNM